MHCSPYIFPPLLSIVYFLKNYVCCFEITGAGGREMKMPLRKWVAWYLVMAMFVIGITPRVYAGFSPSEIVGLSQGERSSDLEKIQKFLEMKMVRERLKEFGLAQDEIQTRLTQLSDQTLHQMAIQLDDLRMGADGGLGIVIALLVIAILVVILIMLLGHRVVVK